ncbi:MAG: hypothetical protein SFT94_00680 [Pseudanabaenaceae cyanobacterium bins.68]|nr:hypothetical protein [Pseudanabaenaceae cyanobacterium bins.68]
MTRKYMVAIIVGCNLLLSLGLLWLAWQVRRAQPGLEQATHNILGYAAACQNGLGNTPANVLKAQQALHQARDRYQELQIKLAKWRSLLRGCRWLVGLVWRSRRGQKSGSRSPRMRT